MSHSHPQPSRHSNSFTFFFLLLPVLLSLSLPFLLDISSHFPSLLDRLSVYALDSLDFPVSARSAPDAAVDLFAPLLRSRSLDLIGFGESCHGDGSSFRAYSRLVRSLASLPQADSPVRYIHFEAGFYDAEVSWACLLTLRKEFLAPYRKKFGSIPVNLSTGSDGLNCLALSVPVYWLNVSETRPMFQWLADSVLTDHPIRPLGIDLGGPSSATLLLKDFNILLDRSHISPILNHIYSRDELDTFQSVLKRSVTNQFLNSSLYPSATEFDTFFTVLGSIERSYRALLSAQVTRQPTSEELEYNFMQDFSYWYQLTRTLDANARMWITLLDTSSGSLSREERLIESMNRRDRTIAENILFHLQTKQRAPALLWTHNGHLMANPTLFDPVPRFLQAEFEYSAEIAKRSVPAGQIIKARIGSRAFLLGGSALSGHCEALDGTEKASVDQSNSLYGEALEVLASSRVPASAPAFIINARPLSEPMNLFESLIHHYPSLREKLSAFLTADISPFFSPLTTMSTVDYQFGSVSFAAQFPSIWDGLIVVRSQHPVTASPIQSASSRSHSSSAASYPANDEVDQIPSD